MEIERVNLSHVQRCHQLWHQMPANEKGRLCTQCHKTIVDFRNYSATKIAETHAKSQEPVCGLYRDEQLLAPQKPERTQTKKAWWFGLASLFISGSGLAQVAKAPTEQQEISPEMVKKELKKSPLNQSKLADSANAVIFGKVTNEFGDPAIQAVVSIKNTSIGGATDFNGFYCFEIPKEIDTLEKPLLLVNMVGYARMTLELPMEKISKGKDVNLDIQLKEMDVVAFGVTIQPPWYKRFWNWLKHPFNNK